MIDKTNAIRILDQNHLSYKIYQYDPTIGLDGVTVAKQIGVDSLQVFKTLVTIGSNNINYVFVVPVDFTLDLKKAANTVKVKSIALIKQKDLFSLTGYIHGGCSMIGMKKIFTTIIDESALTYDSIVFSAGKVGYQIRVNPLDIAKILKVQFFDII